MSEADADYDFKEFDDARVEEAEDRVYAEYKRCQGIGAKMEAQELIQLAHPISLEDMEPSIVISAQQGTFLHNANRLARGDEIVLNISSLINLPEAQMRDEI